MRTAFDIDGVFCSFFNSILVPAAKKMYDIYISLDDCSKWDLTHYGLTSDQITQLFSSEDIIEFYRNAPMILAAQKYLAKSVRDEDIFVTSRGVEDAWNNAPNIALRVKEATLDFLGRYNLFNNVYFIKSKDKADFVVNQGCDVMWEDNPNAAQTLASKGVLVMMPVYDYNRHVRGENIVPILDWETHG